MLREPPQGTKKGNAHDVAREAGIIAALADSGVPVPRVIGIGATGGSFFVMERVPGAPLESEDDARTIDPRCRHELGLQVIKTLARLHRLAPEAVGLDRASHPYVERQIRRVSDAWLRVGSDCAHDAGMASRPRTASGTRSETQGPTVVMHGDFRLSNLLVDDGRITAVLDWELCTVGDAMVDLAWLLDDWRSADEPAISMPQPDSRGRLPDQGGADRRLPGTKRDSASTGSATTADSPSGAPPVCCKASSTRRRSGAMGNHGAIDLDRLDDSIATLLSSAAVHLKE